MLEERLSQLSIASRRLLIALAISIAVVLTFLGVSLLATNRTFIFPVVVIIGMIGGFISLQRRLSELPELEIKLLAHSRLYPWLAPTAGGILAAALYLLFLSGLISGTLFPSFSADPSTINDSGFIQLLNMQSQSPESYAKLFFWSFVAGFSEKFVTNIIGTFESAAVKREKTDA